MKNGKKPTVQQRKFIQQMGLKDENWLVAKDTPEQMVLVHRVNDTIKILPKGVEL